MRLKRRLRKCDGGSAPKRQVRVGSWFRVVTVIVIKVVPSFCPWPREPHTNVFSPYSQDTPLRGWQRLLSSVAKGSQRHRSLFLMPALPCVASHLPALNHVASAHLPFPEQDKGGPERAGLVRGGAVQIWGPAGSGRHQEVQSIAQGHRALPQGLGTSVSVLCLGVQG